MAAKDGKEKPRDLAPRPLVGLGWRWGLRVRGWLWGRHVEPRQRRAQRIKPRGVGISVVCDAATDCRRHRGVLVIGKVNCRHGPDIIGRYLSSKNRGDMPAPELRASSFFALPFGMLTFELV